MSTRSKLITATITAIVSAGIASTTIPAQAVPKMQKCYGIVKKGMNDCGAYNHACAGQASADNDANEWIFLPKGSCEKIVGASLKPKDTQKKDS